MAASVLLVEDDDSLRELLALELEQVGVSVLHARKLKDAREICLAFNPKVIVVDGFLPDGRGIDFIASLGNKRPAVIFMSGYLRDRRSLEALKQSHGVARAFAKPFDVGAMTDEIRSLLAELSRG